MVIFDSHADWLSWESGPERGCNGDGRVQGGDGGISSALLLDVAGMIRSDEAIRCGVGCNRGWMVDPKLQNKKKLVWVVFSLEQMPLLHQRRVTQMGDRWT